MIFVRKDKRVSKRGLSGYVTIGLKLIASALVRRPIRIWVVGGIVIVTVVAGFLTALQTSPVDAASEPNPPLDCTSCHTKTLKFHDKLGSGDKACWVCHDKTDMGMLRLADGLQLPLSESTQLCGQCHLERYDAWKQGTHGIPDTGAAVKCTGCHDPHQPQIALLNITKPHPPPTPSPPPPSTDLLMMIGISLLLVIGIGVVVATKGKRP